MQFAGRALEMLLAVRFAVPADRITVFVYEGERYWSEATLLLARLWNERRMCHCRYLYPRPTRGTGTGHHDGVSVLQSPMYRCAGSSFMSSG